MLEESVEKRLEERAFITVQVGPRNAYTDKDSGLRFYRWQGRDLPSVTSVRRMAGLPFGLHHWTVSQVITAAMEAAGGIAERLGSGDPAMEQVIRSELRSAATAERDRAADLGTAVHDAIAAGRDLEDMPEELRPRARQFKAWLALSGAQLLASEFQVFNLTEGYAGTVDALVRLRDGRVFVVDYKTGKGLYSDHALQVVAYAQAELVGADDRIDDTLTELLGQVSGLALLHLTDDQWEFVQVRYDQETWDAFRGLLRFATWSHTHSNAASFTQARREGAAA